MLDAGLFVVVLNEWNYNSVYYLNWFYKLKREIGNTMRGKYTKIQENTQEYKFLFNIVITFLTQSGNSS